MKKLLSDSEITIVRDIIKLRRKPRQLVDLADSTAGDTVLSTTTEDEGPEAFDTEDASLPDSITETMSEMTATEELVKVMEFLKLLQNVFVLPNVLDDSDVSFFTQAF